MNIMPPMTERDVDLAIAATRTRSAHAAIAKALHDLEMSAQHVARVGEHADTNDAMFVVRDILRAAGEATERHARHLSNLVGR